MAERLSALDHVVILCGRYEGVDERVREHLATETISIGDYVVSGGELPALVIVDAVARLVPGRCRRRDVGGGRYVRARRAARLSAVHAARRSSAAGRCRTVLLSGHHAEIEKWRREQAIERTRRHRPDLLNESEG